MDDAEEQSSGEITRLLVLWREGDRSAVERLFPLLYGELRHLARRQIRRAVGGGTLGTTALVHEAYLKLVDRARVAVEDRRHFFALSSRVMRQILVDHARRRGAEKRGGERREVDLDGIQAGVPPRSVEVLAVEEALARLERVDDRLARLVELRFFGGLSIEEAADAMELSPRTAKRDWQKARAFLYREMSRGSLP